mmetsp:Transcript_69118/g.202386  ORF Transcript_69118/g.202386 Transcript_69118/m.202386 type:complete len:120 (-) Transcript_69118:590-949(-)
MNPHICATWALELWPYPRRNCTNLPECIAQCLFNRCIAANRCLKCIANKTHLKDSTAFCEWERLKFQPIGNGLHGQQQTIGWLICDGERPLKLPACLCQDRLTDSANVQITRHLSTNSK